MFGPPPGGTVSKVALIVKTAGFTTVNFTGEVCLSTPPSFITTRYHLDALIPLLGVCVEWLAKGISE